MHLILAHGEGLIELMTGTAASALLFFLGLVLSTLPQESRRRVGVWLMVSAMAIFLGMLLVLMFMGEVLRVF